MRKSRTIALLAPVMLVLIAYISCAPLIFAQGQVTHEVRAGENLFRIALYYGTTVDAIQAANGLDSIYIYVGQHLIIPDASVTAPPSTPLTPPGYQPEPTVVPTPGSPAIDARTYVVKLGDTLSAIALRLNVSIWSLMDANGLSNWSIIYAGQELIIPDSEPEEPEEAVTPAPEEPEAPKDTYTVQRGDTLIQIAARFNTSVYALSQLNGIANPSQIFVGQVLRLSGNAPVPTGAGKLIVVDLSEQHLYAYEGDQLVFSFIASTGKAPTYTAAGEFRVQSKVPNAWGSTWSIWMPHWLGIYWAGSTENGIHALPVGTNGQTLWAGWLGTPISFGCVVLGTYEASLLYEWAQIGTPVSIRY